jgi:aminoacyl tRNA synthase complex-interacting multifunctional protein 1
MTMVRMDDILHLSFPTGTLTICRLLGLESFLNGDIQEPDEDPRGSEFPDPPVTSLEELLERKAAAKAKKEAESKKGGQPKSADIDISQLDIRVGMITKAWEHKDADKLFCEEIDIGEASPRQIASGLRAHYSVDDLPGQRVLVLANLKSRNMMGFPSHGMVLCASNSDGAVQFIEPPDDAQVGERIFVDGYDGEPATENQVLKKKMLEVIFPDLKTDENGVPCYKGIPLSTSAGSCKPSFANAAIA